jgi:glycine oxidase
VWPQWLAELPVPVFYRADGTLLLWHCEDAQEAFRVERVLASQHDRANVERVNGAQLDELEPALASRFSQALYIPGEAQVDNRELLKAVSIALEETGVECHWETFIRDGEFPEAGVVVDCHGMGAGCNWPRLRGVRGEIVRLHAPEVELHHVLRLLHPRYPVYIVPRAEGRRLVVGATSIEAEDRSPVSVRGALELLTSAYSVFPALAQRVSSNSTRKCGLPCQTICPRFTSTVSARHCTLTGFIGMGFYSRPLSSKKRWRCYVCTNGLGQRHAGRVCVRIAP